VQLEYEFALTAALSPAVPIGEVPLGNRRIREVTGGEVTGERLSGIVRPGGADWLLVGPDGWGRLDVRLTIDTSDGAHIYVQYAGVIEYTEAAQAANAGDRSSDYEDHYFRTAPRLESGDDRYGWVNRTLFVAEGRLHPGPVVEYRVYRVA
jgi:Protein of unknown function (DUF3237)